MDGSDHPVAAAAPVTAATPARQCGTCTMCCKTIEVTEIAKPQHVWCAHCTPGKGCGIYASRPGECAIFSCGWLGDPKLGDEWRPDRSKFVITFEPGTGRVFIACDPTAPSAWRREPYYSGITSSLKLPGAERKQIVILTGRKLTLLVRNGEYDLGEWNRGDDIVINYDRNDRVVKVAVVRAADKKAADVA